MFVQCTSVWGTTLPWGTLGLVQLRLDSFLREDFVLKDVTALQNSIWATSEKSHDTTPMRCSYA